MDEQENDARLLDDVYRETLSDLLRLAYLLTGSKEEAEDVVHDVFARVGGSVATLIEPRPYLHRCVVNEVRSRHRRRLVAQRIRPTAATDLLDDHELTELRDVLLRLPTRQRAAIVLRYLYRLPEAQIADHLGCRPTTVRTLVRRGLARLREEMS